ncbi:MAG: D-2-hydroxyacid dehydrogenase [Runella sp.]
MNIVFLDARTVGTEPNLARFEDFGSLTLYADTQSDQTLERISEAAVVITNKVKITGDMMRQCPSLKLICVAATGTNNIDLETAKQLGIAVKNVKGYSTDSVAQVTVSHLLTLLHSPAYYDAYVKTGEYSKETIFTHYGKPFVELRGKRVGILGLGEIGRQTAYILAAFGAEIVYFSASGQSQNVPYQRVELDELLTTSDVLSIHAPLTPQTAGIIGYAQLQQMKPTALLLNTSRGGIVKEADLARALDDDLIAGAAIDVFEQEPVAANHPYLHLKKPEKLLITPHIAWASVESRGRLVEAIYQNIKSFLEEYSF